MSYGGYRPVNLTALWILIGVNLVLFIATTIYPDLILLLGLVPVAWLARPWTIITNLFIHGDMGHILVNMLTLYFFGSYLCTLVGVRKFLTVYFSGGIVGNIGYMLLASPFSLAIGASGAVFALGGVLTVMQPKLRVYVFPIPAPVPLWLAVIGGFVVISFFPNIAWPAHLGGLAVGLAVGYFWRKRGLRRTVW